MNDTSPLVVENTLHAPVTRVWQALVDPEQMKNWYFDLPGFKAEVGYEFQFEGGTEEHTYVHLCKVTSVIPEQKLSYSWIYKGYDGHSEVTFELFPEDDITHLKLTHEGLHTFPTIPDFARSNFEAGWGEIIGNYLKKYVEEGSMTQI